jgi:ATP-dependent Clp protease ATP-binding subunit ClpC
MSESDDVIQALTPGARHLVETAKQKSEAGKHNRVGVYHWLLALVERHGAMAETLTQGLSASALQRHLREQLHQGNVGTGYDEETLVQQACEHARVRGKKQATERDLAAVILAAAGYKVNEEPVPSALQQPSSSLPGDTATASETASYRPTPKRPTPTLEQFGRDLTRAAQERKLSPVVGREEEIQLVIETLCRRFKRNPVLVGPAGVGKTAIVEGLAQRIVQGEVPEILRGARVLAVQPSTLVAGAGIVGELNKRIEALLGEASQDGIFLFIDEVHSIVGAGGAAGTSDMASLLKPALARGDLACIAATTDEEYRRFIEPDPALERRFQPVRVPELTTAQTLAVLSTLCEEFARVRGVQVTDQVLHWLVDFAQHFLRNRYFPDKAVDLLEHCVAYAVTQGKKAVELTDAEAVAQRMVGMPLALSDRLQALRDRLSERHLMSEEDAHTLLNRLEVTMRGLDLRPTRPNAVVLLTGGVATGSDALAETIAETLFGAAARVVVIDFGRFVHPADVTLLVGAAPGYVGYSDTLPLHRVAQMPWCVVRGENVHACHPQVREVLTQALADGFLTEATGKRIYLSDTIVVLTADVAPEVRRGTVGFGQAGKTPTLIPRQVAERVLGAEFVAHCDLICTGAATAETAQESWLQQRLLSDLSDRYRKQGVHIRWDHSLSEWFRTQHNAPANQRDWERLVEEHLSPLLIPYVSVTGAQEERRLLVKFAEGTIHVEAYRGDETEKTL